MKQPHKANIFTLILIFIFLLGFFIVPTRSFVPKQLYSAHKLRTLLHISKSDNSEESLKTMKLTDLRSMLRLYGGKPGSLRKTELINECKRFAMIGINSIPQIRNYNSTIIDFASSNLAMKNTNIGMIPVPTAKDAVKRWSRATPSHDDHHTLKGKASNNNDWSSSTKAMHPTGPNRDKRLMDRKGCEMDLTFLGTASCIPGITRGVSCVAMRYIADTWLFDCGEGTQIQLRKSKIRCSRINKIFITHSHGDHSFGLAGVLCMIGQSQLAERERMFTEGKGETIEPVEIYGPEGIRDLVRAVLQLTFSKITVPHRIHELKNVEYLHTGQPPSPPSVRTNFDPVYGEREGGRDIYPEADGSYFLFSEGPISVRAAPMQHTIPCVGYVVQEEDRAGALMPELVKDVLLSNKKALKKQYEAEGKDPMIVYKELKNLQPEAVFTFPDGSVVRGKDIVKPPLKGRKIVIMGDTCSGERIAKLAQDCDVLVHEATNAYFPEDASERKGGYAQLERETHSHGHSTPQMAGRFAASVRTRMLILSHFSSRYPGDDSPHSMGMMWLIEDMARRALLQARKSIASSSSIAERQRSSANPGMSSEDSGTSNCAAGEPGPNDIVAAWDFMSVAVAIPDFERRDANTKHEVVKIHQ